MARTPPPLTLVTPPREAGRFGREVHHHFCGRCGHAPDPEDAVSRVCRRCGMGLVLRAAPEVAPNPLHAFLVVDRAGDVAALSKRAERVLGVEERAAAGSPLVSLVQGEELDAALHRAASGEGGVVELPVQVLDAQASAWWARIGPCESPQAALLVLTGRR